MEQEKRTTEQWRRYLGLTQQEISTGVDRSVSTVNDWINTNQMPTSEAVALAQDGWRKVNGKSHYYD